MGRKGIAIIVAIGVGLLAGAGAIYLHQQGRGLPFSPWQSATDSNPAAAPAPSEPQAAAPAEPAQQPTPQAEATGAVKPKGEPTAVPSFDVVVIEPSGEGVVAGRAAPGWQVSVQSGGAKVGSATADAQGEWSVVLDKPLPAGDHSLSLKITSPDGTRALSSQEWVRVEVDPTKNANTPAVIAANPAPATAQTEVSAVPPTVASDASPQTARAETIEADAAAPAEAAPERGPALALNEPQGGAQALSVGESGTQAAPPKPALVFKTVDYEDTGPAIGSVTITGTSNPGATISVYYDDEPLATVRADRDGQWRLAVEKKLGMGQHNFRAERIDPATGKPSGHATIAIERMAPKPPPQIAAKEDPAAAPLSPVAATESGQKSKDIYTIRRGDTLWAIAKRYFGSGLRYTTIFQDNRETIHNPDLIHPQQQVKVPPP
jgi:nucleoid-associated protein YgaU